MPGGTSAVSVGGTRWHVQNEVMDVVFRGVLRHPVTVPPQHFQAITTSIDEQEQMSVDWITFKYLNDKGM